MRSVFGHWNKGTLQGKGGGGNGGEASYAACITRGGGTFPEAQSSSSFAKMTGGTGRRTGLERGSTEDEPGALWRSWWLRSWSLHSAASSPLPL